MTKQYKVTLCYDLLGTHSVGTKVTVSDSTRWFGYKLCGTWFAPSRICFNEIGTDLHVFNGCRYQNMNRLTRWCHFPLFFFLVTPFFCVKPRCLGMIKWQNNTKSHNVTTCLVLRGYKGYCSELIHTLLVYRPVMTMPLTNEAGSTEVPRCDVTSTVPVHELYARILHRPCRAVSPRTDNSYVEHFCIHQRWSHPNKLVLYRNIARSHHKDLISTNMCVVNTNRVWTMQISVMSSEGIENG